MVRSKEAVKRPRHWITEDLRRIVRDVWLAGNDFTMDDIARVLKITAAQVRYAVRDLPKTRLQQTRADSARRAGGA